MKKLKLTELAENEIEKKQLDEIKGGYSWPFCFIPCTCKHATHVRRGNRVSKRN